MPDSEQNTALLPAPIVDTEAGGEAHNATADEEPFRENDEPVSENTAAVQKPSVGTVIKKSVILLLSAVSVLVFGITTVYAVLESSFDSTFITRLMLGDFYGGIDSVRAVTVYEADYISIQPDSSKQSFPLHPLDSLAESESAEQQIVRQTLPAGSLVLSNETPYDPDMDEILAMERVIPAASELYALYGTDAPLVLILHTHGTEAFAEHAGDDYRSTDTSENIVSVGAVIAEKLEENGISTIHCTTMFDEADFTMAYYNASLEIRKLLDTYPSISYVLDVHRDSIAAEGVYIAPTTESEKGLTAQMMLVIGTDYGGSGHKTWRNNLSLAARLHTVLNENTPQLMRDINLRSASFNEQYSDGSLLLEIGACASTLEEAHRSAELFADALAVEILGE